MSYCGIPCFVMLTDNLQDHILMGGTAEEYFRIQADKIKQEKKRKRNRIRRQRQKLKSRKN